MAQPVNDTSTQNDARPAAASAQPTAVSTYSQDDQASVKLIAEMLDAAGNTVGRNKSPSKEKAATAYSQLHNAFRNLFKLRGQAFLDGFSAFVSAVNTHPEGIFYLPLANQSLGDFSNASEREAFLVFINMVIRFARAKDKANFAKVNNVARLSDRMSDPELRSLLRAAFLAE